MGNAQRFYTLIKKYVFILVGVVCIEGVIAPAVFAATSRGASQMPYTRYDSSASQLGGGAKLIQAQNFDQSSLASEASGQAYVALSANGSFVQWKIITAGRGVDLRFTMPDSGDGKGLSGSLDVLVNGKLDQKLNLSSYHAWQYFTLNNSDPSNTPLGNGSKQFMRFDEVHFALSQAVQSGDVISIQKSNGDGIEYGIDFIEVEPIPDPKPKPQGFVSITDYGANGADNLSDLDAMNKALAAAGKLGTGVYIPAGKFIFDDKLVLTQSNIKIQGAGIWYTNIYFNNPGIFKGGIYARVSNVEISDFYMDTINNQREASPGNYMIYKGFMGTYGKGSSIHDVWVEHFECGAWIGGYDMPYPVDVTTGLTISNSRFRNNYADGVNFAQGTSNSTVDNSNIRNSGDDGLAMWPSNSPAAQNETGNTFSNDTIEHVWRAAGVAIFGGNNHQVYNLLIKDCIASSGIRFTNDFPGYTFDQNGLTKVSNIDIENCGTSYDLWNQSRGAIEFYAQTGIYNIEIDNVSILNSQRHAVQIFGTLQNVTFNHVSMNGTGLDGHVRDQQMNTYGGLGVWAQGNSGGVTFNDTSITNYKDQQYVNLNQAFNLVVNVGQGDPDTPYQPSLSSSGSVASSAGGSASTGSSSDSTSLTTSSSGGAASKASSSSSSGSSASTSSGSPTAPASSSSDSVAAPSSDGSASTAPSSSSSATGSSFSASSTSMIPVSSPSYFFIRNKWHGEYLYDDGSGQLRYRTQQPGANDAAYQWSFESKGAIYQGIKNRQTGSYINIEHLQDYVQSDTSCPPVVGDSCKWAIEEAGGGYIRLRNGWHLGDYLHVQDQKGYVQHGAMYPIWDSAQWQLVAADGTGIGNADGGYYIIKNRWNSAYIYDNGNGQLSYSMDAPMTNTAYQWSFEARGNGLYDIKNRSTGDYINIERLLDYVQSDVKNKPVTWDSSKWAIEAAPDGYYRFRNGWHISDYMHVQDLKGYVQHGMIYPIWESAQWQIFKVSTLYGFQSKAINRCISAGNTSNNPLAVLLNNSCDMNDSYQTWTVKKTATDGLYQIISTASTLCLDVSDPSNLKLSGCDLNSSGQLWSMVELSNGSKVYRIKSSTVQKCLGAATSGEVDVLHSLTLVSCDNGINQQFKMISGSGTIGDSDVSGQLVLSTAPDTADSTNQVSSTKTDVPVPSDTTSSSTPTSDSGTSQSVGDTSTSSDTSTGNSSSGSGTTGASSSQVATGVLPTSSGTSSPSSTSPAASSSSAAPAASDTSLCAGNTPLPNAAMGRTTVSVAPMNIPGVPSSRGASVPWTEYQAEDGQTNGEILGPSRQKWDASHIEAEAIGRKAVRLTKDGDYVSFKNLVAGNGVVVRYSIPDAPSGGGITASIGLYVNDVRWATLALTSHYAWSYKGGLIGDPIVDTPAEQPHTFFDEVRVRLNKDIPANATVKIKYDASVDKAASFFIIDLVDIEPVPDPIQMPPGFRSVTEFGVSPNDCKDHADDILKAMKSTPKLWFPPGNYRAEKLSGGNVGLDNPGIEIRGAGMWYTNISGPKAMFFCSGNVKCVFGDFSITGEAVARDEESVGPQKAFAGPMGTGSLIENVWIEHEVGGIWVGNDPPYQNQPTQNLTIRNCRIRDTYADGINLDNGTSNSVVENCHMRNTGDDAVAIWSVKWTDWVKAKTYEMGDSFIKPEAKNAPDQGQDQGNTIRNVTVQMPWRANCFAAYGGQNDVFENNVCEDVLTYPGILIDDEFSPYPFGPQLTVFTNISLIRAGGPMFFENTANPWTHGALKLYMREGDVNDILVDGIDIIDPTYSGIEFRGFGQKYVPAGENIYPPHIVSADNAKFSNVTIRNVTITNAGTYGIEVRDGGGKGQVKLENVSVQGSAKGALNLGDAPATFIVKGTGNSGW